MTDEKFEEISKELTKVPSLLICEREDGVHFQAIKKRGVEDTTEQLLLAIMDINPVFAQQVEFASLAYKARRRNRN